MASERIEKFFDDARHWTDPNARNDGKAMIEMSRLSKWMIKHQSESVSDGSKNRLLSVVELFFRYIPRDTSSEATVQLTEAKSALISDYLKLPEGKLVNSKLKRRALSWIEQLSTQTHEEPSVQDCEYELGQKWMVADIAENGTLSLMREDVESEDILEGVAVASTALLRRITAQFEEEGFATVLLAPQSPPGALPVGSSEQDDGRRLSQTVVIELLPLDRNPENNAEDCRSSR